MIKSVLLTRSQEFNIEFKNYLEKYNYEILECSLISYELQPLDFQELNSFDNIIITSFYAATQMPNASRKDIGAWVVGVKSAKILEKKGYKIKFISNDARSLSVKIPSSIYDNVIYLSSNHITVNMPSAILRKIFYKVTYKQSLSNEQILRYKENIDYILIYSENCAKALVKLLIENDLMNYLENSTFIVISLKVENIIKNYFKNTKILSSGDLMLKCLVEL